MNMENIAFSEATKKLMGWYNIEDVAGFSYSKYLENLNKKEEHYQDLVKVETISSLLSSVELTRENMQKIFLLFCQQNLIPSDRFTIYCLEEFKKPLNDFMEKVPQEVKSQLSDNIQLTKKLKHVAFEEQRDFNAEEAKSGYIFDKLEGQYEDENERYLFPIILPGNIIVGFSGRSLVPHIIKYQTNLNFNFNKTDLMYGLDRALLPIKEKGYVIVVEGILDLYRCRKAGFYNVISPCSTYLSESHILLLKALTKRFLLVFDNDQGGQSATELSEKNLDKYRLLYERILLPEGEDPDSFGKQNIEALRNLLTSPW